MKNLLTVILLIVVVLAVIKLTKPKESYCNIKPYELTCEYRKAPEGIDTTSPRLSWKVSSELRNQQQAAYQLIVASSPDLADSGHGDLWDSGKVQSDNTLYIKYQGKPLMSYQQCWWAVRVWDKDGNKSPWTKPSYWSMGILSPELWAAKWLGYHAPYSTEEDIALKGNYRQTAPSPIFRKEFSIDKEISRASLYVCGLGFHESYLNGDKVGDNVLDPAFTRYDRASLYVAHDVTHMINNGDNALGVMLGNGWYNVFTRAAWDFDRAPWRRFPEMLAQLYIEYTDGTTQTIVSDDTWKASTGPVIVDGIRQSEIYDARKEKTGWANPGYDDSSWASPELTDGPGGSLRAQVAPPVKVTASIAPVSVTEPSPGVFVYDLGQNIAGWAQLKVSGPAGTTIKLRYSERIKDDGNVDLAAIKMHVRDKEFGENTYILKGDGTEIYEPRFEYYGFQYVEVTGYPGKPADDAIIGKVVNTDFKQIGQFSCSNELLNKMHHAILWAYRSNFQGYPTDCPHREKNGWTGDAHLASDQAMYNWANGGGYTKWMLDMKDEQRDSGELPGIVPTGGWGYAWGNGPAWDSAYLIIPWNMYCYFGDTGILETHFERFKRYVDYLTSKSENYIVSIGLNDWAPVKTETPGDVTSTGFYYVDTLITARAAEILGHKEDADKYFAQADAIYKAFQNKFYNGDGTYSVKSQTAMAFPMFCGLVPDAEKDKVIDKLLENITANGDHIDTGILGAKAIFNVLADNGKVDTAYKMIVNPTEPSYANWIAKGATTFWEFWNGADSQNHIMFGDIGAWFYKNIAGIRLAPEISGNEAFKYFVLKPLIFGDITSVNASTDSVRGKIASKWQITDNAFNWDITIPANTSAQVCIPSANADSVTETGKPAKNAEGVSFIKIENGYAIYNVASGKYSFSSILK